MPPCGVLYIATAPHPAQAFSLKNKFEGRSMKTILKCAAAALAFASSIGHAQTAVTAEDNAEIQALAARYAAALGGCDADGFASLFEPAAGYFASGFRGVVVGRERLVGLVKSERHCIAPNPNGSQRPGGNAPTVEVGTDAQGVFGTVKIG